MHKIETLPKIFWHRGRLTAILLDGRKNAASLREGSAVKTFGQIVYVEQRPKGGANYHLAVFRVRGGLQGKWSCEACQLDAANARIFPTLDNCIASVRDDIDKHHADKHGG